MIALMSACTLNRRCLRARCRRSRRFWARATSSRAAWRSRKGSITWFFAARSPPPQWPLSSATSTSPTGRTASRSLFSTGALRENWRLDMDYGCTRLSTTSQSLLHTSMANSYMYTCYTMYYLRQFVVTCARYTATSLTSSYRRCSSATRSRCTSSRAAWWTRTTSIECSCARPTRCADCGRWSSITWSVYVRIDIWCESWCTRTGAHLGEPVRAGPGWGGCREHSACDRREKRVRERQSGGPNAAVLQQGLVNII